jgi:peptidoglycan/LPS O-acetylase OafA/YrhL
MTARDHVVRKDIEGLRALAVISVLINHAFPDALPGGFVGVDVFFVISGYLIGRHLLQDIQGNRFSVLTFYLKRARRIFPALALVLISVWGIGWLVLSAPEFSNLGQHIVASAFFSNNILLWSESGYFDVVSLDKPLLHLWSLGIEEQFYLLVPAMLWLGSEGSAGSVRWVARLGVASLLATIILSNFDYAASFYLLHTRFWELAAGVILAQAALRMHVRSLLSDAGYSFERNEREILAFAAATLLVCVVVLVSSEQRWERDVVVRDIGLILASIIAVAALLCMWRQRLLHALLQKSAHLANASSIVGIILICGSAGVLSSTNWPGAQTLFPVLGTAMVIAATPATAVNSALSRQPLVFVGGISYPLYLWHWPAIVFWNLLNPVAHGAEMMIPLVAAVALAWLTKVLVEDPVRFGKLGLASFPRPHLRLVVAGLVLATALGSLASATHGLPSRIPSQLRPIAEWSEANPSFDWRSGRCYFPPQSYEEFSPECAPHKRLGVPSVLLWGDSHAAHLYPGLVDLQSKHDFDIIQWTAGLCPPGVIPLVGESVNCPARRATASRLLTHFNPDTILLAGAWELYLGNTQSEADILRSLSATIRELKKDGDRQIVIFGPGPTWNTSLATDLFRFMVARKMNEIPERYGRASAAAWHLDAAMAAQATALNVHYVSVLSNFCSNSGCRTVGDKSLQRPDLLFYDRDHLTISGSKDLIAHSGLPFL